MTQKCGRPGVHGPRLGSILMVEDAVMKYSGKYTKFGLWRWLPKSMMYQTYQTILNYLINSNKIKINHEGKIVWISNKSAFDRMKAKREA